MFFQRIKKAKFIAILPHSNPDGDAIGSSLGLYHAFEFNGIRSVVVCKEEINRKLQFIPGSEKIKNKIPVGCDLVVSVDTAVVNRMSINTQEIEIITIDHHLSNSGFGTINLVRPEFASTAEVVYEFLIKNNLKINRPCAKALYTAIVSDSRSFITPRVTDKTFSIAGELVKKGADIKETTQNLRYSMGLGEMRLFGEALGSFELIENGRFSICVITLEMLEVCGARYSDTEDIADFLLCGVTVEASALIIETGKNRSKCSLRSKNSFSVLEIGKKFGGGGHINAAGFNIELEPQEVKSQLVEAFVGGAVE